jgi:type II secretory pathway pseudopilin PulG
MTLTNCPHCGVILPAGATTCPSCGRAATAPDKGTRWVIFGVVGAGCALLALVMAGIVAALLIPNFLDALQKAKQKRTLAEMRTLGAALESFHQRNSFYPAGDTVAAVVAQLAGDGYTGAGQDGWKRDLRWACFEPDGGGCAAYELVSPGRDGVFAAEPGGYEEGAFPVTEYDSDVVLANGMFARWPEGEGRFGAGG